MVNLSSNNSNNVRVSAGGQRNINVNSPTDNNINANNNGNSQRARSWAIGEGLIDGEDYSAKYWAEQAKISEEIARESIDAENNAHIWAEGTDDEVEAIGGTHSSKGWVDYVIENAPTASVEETEQGAVLTVTDINGTTTATIYNGAAGQDGQDGAPGQDGRDGTDGADGQDGQDGFSPIATVSKSGSTATISITDANGTTTTTITDGTNGTNGTNGQDGQDGEDGFSPTATVTKSGNTATITITDKNGTTTANVYDGTGGGGSYTAGNGIDITNDVISIDNTVALKSDIPTVTQEVFIAEYGTTTYQDVLDAYNMGKAIYAKRQVTSGSYEVFSLCGKQPTTFWFANSGGFSQRAMFILPQSTAYTLDAQDTWGIGTFTNASNTLSNVVAIDASSAVQTALDDKVSKAGDTMTGVLTVEKSLGNYPIKLQANDITYNVVPSVDTYCGLSIVDSNGDLLGYIINDAMADGRRRIRLNTRNLDGSTSTNFTLGFTANGTAYCSFPDTSRCDGQWIANNQSIIDTVSLNGSSNLNKTVTLPNDGSKYEVLFSCSVTSGSTSGDYAHVILNSSQLNAGVNVCYARARTNAIVTASGNIIIPMEYGSNNLTITRSTNYTGTGTVAVRAYRRIGTNS